MRTISQGSAAHKAECVRSAPPLPRAKARAPSTAMRQRNAQGAVAIHGLPRGSRVLCSHILCSHISCSHGLRQRFRGAAAECGIFGRGAKILAARIGRVDFKLGEDAARPRRHHHDAARQIDRLEHRMGDEHDRGAKRLPHLQEIVVELEARDLVERGERLVHQQQRRLGDQRAGDGNAHAHAARQFARIGAAELLQPDPVERRDDPRPRLLDRDALELERQQHVVEHARPRHQRRLLEHEADAAFAVRGRARGRPFDRAFARLAQAGDDAQGRRFAAT